MIGPVGKRVAANLYALRTARGITRSQLAARLRDIGHPLRADTLRAIENGRAEVDYPKTTRHVDVDDLLALASVLAVQPARLWAASTKCDTCFGTPPPGFICAECAARGPARRT